MENRDLAAAFMVLIVAWTMLGFAIGELQRASLFAGFNLLFAILILVFIPLIRSGAPNTALAAGVIGALNFVVIGLAGVLTNVIFSNAVIAAFSAFYAFFAFRAYVSARAA
ncbi:MAG: hypothetical protein V3U17_04475 [Thermoplasmata archaeon]